MAVTYGSNLTLVASGDPNQFLLSVTPKWIDFNLALSYIKGDESQISVKFKVKPRNSTKWYYVIKSNEFAEEKKREYILDNSDNVVMHVDAFPQYSELIIEITFGGTPSARGSLDVTIFTYTY